MNTPTARPIRQRPACARFAPIRLRAEMPPVTHLQGTSTTHDFLVPNPRPDLICDRHTLRMIEAG